jgi:predicted transcriptional regulator YdeE
MRLTAGILVAVFVSGATSISSPNQEESVTKAVLQQPFFVAGYLVRTNNTDEASGHGKIGDLWQRFYKENLGAQIPNRSDSALTVVYSEYSSDETGDYNYLLGARVTSVTDLPPGMVWKKVDPGPYAVITTDIGQMPGVLQAAWRKIWQMSPTELGGKRAFVTDYEIYDARSANPAHAQVEIHVGVTSNLK